RRHCPCLPVSVHDRILRERTGDSPQRRRTHVLTFLPPRGPHRRRSTPVQGVKSRRQPFKATGDNPMSKSETPFFTNPIRRRLLGASAAAASASLLPRVAFADKWPSKPIRFIAAQAPGASTDGTARSFADYFATHLGVPVVVENRPGAAGMIAADLVAKSPPDGYTFLVTLHSQLAQAPVLLKKPPLNPDTDLVPIGEISTGRGVMVARKDLPARDFKEVIELARKQ